MAVTATAGEAAKVQKLMAILGSSEETSVRLVSPSLETEMSEVKMSLALLKDAINNYQKDVDAARRTPVGTEKSIKLV
eukprot:CAMPEP_0178440808 /NCGR_PEP_ID=MMETSP0689_2-20121128/37025_1 /TAXON_ID=160604 /ORGANISM="Amphidinium massartii, Strain CS-259" /LENGTH=77 /DNA_ID=CAMNT_0020063705 /DNA_START=26 /DNA_END=259 /DNA_ORIENTATION=+